MKIKCLILIIFFFGLFSEVRSQGFEWIRSEPVSYALNPSYPESAVAFDQSTNRVIHSRIDTVSLIFGSYVLGTSFVESRDTTGLVLWQYEFGSRATLQRITTDLNGNIYIGGVFEQTLYLGPSDSLEFITGTFNFLNTFIVKLDSGGNLVWKRNITGTWPNYEGIEALAVDASGYCWYAMSDFFIAKIIRMDASGIDQDIHTIDNGKRIGNISFDPWNGMYVSGSAQGGNFIMDADTFTASSFYNMFIARFDTSGQPSWVHFGHDITFQKPMVIADHLGNAFMAGNRYDTTSFNGMFFPNPVLSADFFGFKIDSSGVISWTLHQPALIMGPFGNFEQGSNLMVDVDASGKFYMGGIQKGTVDWGFGVVSSTPGSGDRKIAITCIDPAGKVQYVKMGGGNSSNYMHALAVSDNGACYFTGAFRDSAEFGPIILNTTNLYNFAIGKINPTFPSGIEDHDVDDITLYPNPSNEFVVIPEKLRNSYLSIYDSKGKLVYNNVNINSVDLNIDKFNDGIYSFVFLKNNEVFKTKIVVVN